MGASRARPAVISHTRNPVRRALHIVVSGLAWIVFGYFWYQIFARPMDRGALATFAIILVVLAGIVLLNALWIWFNLGIHRSRAPRNRVREVPIVAVDDRLGRKLEGADWPRLRGHAWIRVEVDEQRGTKTYRAASPVFPGLESPDQDIPGRDSPDRNSPDREA